MQKLLSLTQFNYTDHWWRKVEVLLFSINCNQALKEVGKPLFSAPQSNVYYLYTYIALQGPKQLMFN